MKFAVVFPGQGSQSVNMLAELGEQYPIVIQTFEEASSTLGYDLWELVSQNPDDKLNQTEYTQPVMLAGGVAVWRVWQHESLPAPSYLAGHSLGEYTALVASGVLSFSNAIKLVAERGRLMQEAVPAGAGAMAAILGLEDDDVQAICKQAAEGEVVEAVNFNTQEQVVIAGHSGAVARAIEQAVAVGAKRALLLPVSVPSHSSLMITAAEKLYERMSMMTFHPPKIPVFHNIDAANRAEPEAIMEALKLQLHSPVLWVDTINAMVDEGVDAVFELGPGKVLAGLCRRIDKALQVVAVDSPAGLQKAMTALKGETV